MNIKPEAFLLSFALLLTGCDYHTTQVSEPVGNAIYSHSFESPADTIGWSGYGSLELYPSAPGGGGSWSVRVSGGCVVPHAQTRIRIQSDVGQVVLQCWGKNLALGGGVQLYKISDQSVRISVQITDTVWTQSRSTETLTCSANDTLVLEMVSGGIIYSAMLIDKLEILKVQ